MTKRQLIEALSTFSDEAQVFIHIGADLYGVEVGGNKELNAIILRGDDPDTWE